MPAEPAPQVQVQAPQERPSSAKAAAQTRKWSVVSQVGKQAEAVGAWSRQVSAAGAFSRQVSPAEAAGAFSRQVSQAVAKEKYSSEPNRTSPTTASRAPKANSAGSLRHAELGGLAAHGVLAGLEDSGGSTGIHGGMLARLQGSEAQKERRKQAFEKFQEQGQLDQEVIPQALELAGFPMPEQTWIDEVFRKITQFSTLDLEEWYIFVEEYDTRQIRVFSEIFHRHDVDHSGSMELVELAELFQSCGITPFKEVIWEIIGETGLRGAEHVTFEEFRVIMELIRTREGFPGRVVDFYKEAFAKFDRDESGTMDREELADCLRWLGYSFDDDTVDAMMYEVDRGTSKDGLTWHSFLVCMRKFREREVAHMEQILTTVDKDGSGTINSVEEVQQLLQHLGYFPNSQAIREATEDAGLLKQSLMKRQAPSASQITQQHLVDMGLHELWKFLEVYRARDGFTREEVTEVHEAFVHYDKSGLGEISTLQIGKILRWLGFPTTHNEQQLLTSTVDVDKSGLLNQGELRKLIRLYLERDIVHMKAVFEQNDLDNLGLLTRSQAYLAWKSLHLPIKDNQQLIPQVSEQDGSDGEDAEGRRDSKASGYSTSSKASKPRKKQRSGISVFAFVDVARQLRRIERDRVRASAGYSSEEVEGMKAKFDHYDEDGSGAISNRELAKLLEDVFPEIATSRRLRPIMLEILKEADQDGDGQLDFNDFLRLMRQFHNLQERDRVRKELEAVKETGFRTEEVEEFRTLFLGTLEAGKMEIPFSEFARIIGNITPLGDMRRSELKRVFVDTIAADADGGGARDPEDAACDFPEYIRLMRLLLDTDFGSLNAISRQLASGERRTSSRG